MSNIISLTPFYLKTIEQLTNCPPKSNQPTAKSPVPSQQNDTKCPKAKEKKKTCHVTEISKGDKSLLPQAHMEELLLDATAASSLHESLRKRCGPGPKIPWVVTMVFYGSPHGHHGILSHSFQASKNMFTVDVELHESLR